MNFNKSKWIPLIIFLIALGILIYLGIIKPNSFSPYSDLVSTISTLMFVYLTYETLRQTRQNENLPLINIEFLIMNKMDDAFIKANPTLVMNEQVKKLQEDFKNDTPPKKDMIFVIAENIGGTTAIGVKLDINYSKQMFGKNFTQTVNIPFGTLKAGENRVELVECFEDPAKNDYFEIKEIKTIFNTVSRQHFSERPKKTDILDSFTLKNGGQDTTIIFKR